MTGAKALVGNDDASVLRLPKMLLLGRAALLIPEGNLILLAFPNDRRMPLFYGERLSAWLSIHAPEAAGVKPNGLRWWVREWNVEVLRYIPEKRLTLRCHGRIEADTGVVRDFSFILKQFKNKNNAKRLYQNLTALEKGRAAPLVSIPRAVAFDGDNRLVAMEELKGTSLKRALPEIDIEPVMRAAGEMIATFHQTRGSIPETVSRHDELKEVQDAVKARLRALAGTRLTDQDEVVIDARATRSQAQNRADARARLAHLLAAAARPPKPRRATKPSAGARASRLDAKKLRSRIKKARRSTGDD
jgi:ribosome-associated protein